MARPDIVVQFGMSQSTALWIINICTGALAALLLAAVGDRRGCKPVLLTGLVIVGIASISAGLAGPTEILLASRGGAAMIMPVTLAVIMSSFPAGAHSQAIGVWTTVAGAGGLLGMFLAALLVDVAYWRWLFVLPVWSWSSRQSGWRCGRSRTPGRSLRTVSASSARSRPSSWWSG